MWYFTVINPSIPSFPSFPPHLPYSSLSVSLIIVMGLTPTTSFVEEKILLQKNFMFEKDTTVPVDTKVYASFWKLSPFANVAV